MKTTPKPSATKKRSGDELPPPPPLGACPGLLPLLGEAVGSADAVEDLPRIVVVAGIVVDAAAVVAVDAVEAAATVTEAILDTLLATCLRTTLAPSTTAGLLIMAILVDDNVSTLSGNGYESPWQEAHQMQAEKRMWAWIETARDCSTLRPVNTMQRKKDGIAKR